MKSVYKVKDNVLYLDTAFAAEAPYRLKLNDLPNEDRPREKLALHGVGALSVVELVALILTTGTKKEDVLEMSSRILKEYGEHILADYTDPEKMAADLDIPMTKAMQIVACAELGRRFFDERSQRSVTIRTAKDVYEHVRDMHHLPKEHLRGLYLNVHHKLVHDVVLSIGTLTTNLIHPREVFKPALQCNAAAVILVHNHPSGEVMPSAADVEVTKQIVEAGNIMGISVLDHVVVAGDKYMSIDVNYN